MAALPFNARTQRAEAEASGGLVEDFCECEANLV